MGKIWMPGGGGGGVSSDDCTLMRAAVPKGLTAVTADFDDEALRELWIQRRHCQIRRP